MLQHLEICYFQAAVGPLQTPRQLLHQEQVQGIGGCSACERQHCLTLFCGMTVPSADSPVMTAMMPIARGSDDSSRTRRFHVMFAQLFCGGATAAAAVVVEVADGPTAAAGSCGWCVDGTAEPLVLVGADVTSGAFVTVTCCTFCCCSLGCFFLPASQQQNVYNARNCHRAPPVQHVHGSRPIDDIASVIEACIYLQHV
jgi:hypothetical protein